MKTTYWEENVMNYRKEFKISLPPKGQDNDWSRHKALCVCSVTYS